jgi:hypothetical protein
MVDAQDRAGAPAAAHRGPLTLGIGMRALAILAALLSAGCVSGASRGSDSDRELLKWMPPGSQIAYKRVTEYGVTHRVRIVQLLPFAP